MKIIVFSIDYDGCTAPVYGPTFLKKYIPYHEYNKQLCDEITTSSVGADRIILMVGSSRQSASTDKLNIIKPDSAFTSSVFADLTELETYLKSQGLPVEINSFLIDGDLTKIIQMEYIKKTQQLIKTYDHDQNGDQVIRSLESICDPFSLESLQDRDKDDSNAALFANPDISLSHSCDTCKIHLLTEQLRHIAFNHPNDEIMFNFIDDREGDILFYLKQYFTKNSVIQDNTPSFSFNRGITLRLHHYVCGLFSHQKNYADITITFCLQQENTPTPPNTVLSKHCVSSIFTLPTMMNKRAAIERFITKRASQTQAQLKPEPSL